MSRKAIAEIKLRFEKGDKPNEQDFIDLIDSLHDEPGIAEAPIDTKPYVRQDGDWLELPPSTGGGASETVHTLDGRTSGLSIPTDIVVADNTELAATSATENTLAKVLATNELFKYRRNNDVYFTSLESYPQTVKGVFATGQEFTDFQAAPVDLNDGDIFRITEWSQYQQYSGGSWNYLGAYYVGVTVATLSERDGLVVKNGDYINVAEDGMVYQAGFDTWQFQGKDFFYKYSVADFATEIGAIVDMVHGDWLHDTTSDEKYVYLTSDDNVRWESMGTKDWTQYMYLLGANNETALYVYGGQYNVFGTHENLKNKILYPQNTQLKVLLDSGPRQYTFVNTAGINFGDLQLHDLTTSPIIPLNQSGLILNYGITMLFRSREGDSSEQKWYPESSNLPVTGSSNCDGWGNDPEPNKSGNLQQRYSISQIQHEKLTGSAGVVNADELHTHAAVAPDLSAYATKAELPVASSTFKGDGTATAQVTIPIIVGKAYEIFGLFWSLPKASIVPSIISQNNDLNFYDSLLFNGTQTLSNYLATATGEFRVNLRVVLRTWIYDGTNAHYEVFVEATISSNSVSKVFTGQYGGGLYNVNPQDVYLQGLDFSQALIDIRTIS